MFMYCIVLYYTYICPANQINKSFNKVKASMGETSKNLVFFILECRVSDNYCLD